MYFKRVIEIMSYASHNKICILEKKSKKRKNEY